ncbi:hypothetical protein, conserved [Leishmania tarentolae]|uniref:FYVE-type domain-containing protein n=1 Tax=Leishmania tarentolae TaxID=5689 RepID=A0A640KE69_LEITA|nr:hypothetical protein, conserved [Leishmania tarentolae]
MYQARRLEAADVSNQSVFPFLFHCCGFLVASAAAASAFSGSELSCSPKSIWEVPADWPVFPLPRPPLPSLGHCCVIRVFPPGGRSVCCVEIEQFDFPFPFPPSLHARPPYARVSRACECGMPSKRRKNKQQWTQEYAVVQPRNLSEGTTISDGSGSANGESVVSNSLPVSSKEVRSQGPATSATSSPKKTQCTVFSLAGREADKDVANNGGSVNANGVTNASLALLRSLGSMSSKSDESPAAGLRTREDMPTRSEGTKRDLEACPLNDGAGLLHLDDGDEDTERDDEVLADAVAAAGAAATDSTGEIFYVELDPQSHGMTGVLPEMQRLHVRLTKLVRVLRHRVARLCVLRERARLSGDDVSEVVPASPPPARRPSPLPAALPVPSVAHRLKSAMDSNSGAMRNGSSNIHGDLDAIGMSAGSHQSPRQCNPAHKSGGVIPSPRNGTNSCLASARRYTQQSVLDNDSEWCDAGTFCSSRSTTAQSTPSLQPFLPPPSLQFFEEDELDDDGRVSLLTCSSMAARRSYTARFRPESMPLSMQTTPSMLPANSVPYARSDNGGMLSLPPSTSAVGHRSLQQQQQQQQQLTSLVEESAAPPPIPPPASPGSGMFSSSVKPPTIVDGTEQQETTRAALSAGAAKPLALTDEEKKELRRLSWCVAELYRRRGLLLQQADRLLCRHAQQHERWEGNEERRGCYRCRRLFSYLTRRHHCRRCGRLCCAECSRYFGKKQDTSYVAAPQDAGRVSLGVEHRVIIKSEYTAHITAEDTHELVEERFDEHTYPRRGYSGAGDSPNLQSEKEVEMQDTAPVLDDNNGQLPDPSFVHTEDAAGKLHGRSRQHKWVRVCAPCYQNCLRARRNNVLQHLKSANLCILDDGFYYYHVMTTEELCRLSTALNKPDSFKKQVELMSHVVVERSADYVAAAPGYSAHTLTAAAQHTPDVLRTLGSIGAYAFRSARQTANDYVGGYLAGSRTILPDNHIDTTGAEHSLSVSNVASGDGRDDGNEEARSEVSLMSVDDACSDVQVPLTGGTEDNAHEQEDGVDKGTDEDAHTNVTCDDGPIDVQT